MNELRLQLTEKEKEFLSQYAQVYDDERKRDGTRDPIVLVQTKTEVLAPEGAEDLCKYSLHIDDYSYSEEELLDENEVAETIRNFLDKSKEDFLEIFSEEEIDDLFNEILDDFCYSTEWRGHIFEWYNDDLELSIKTEKYFIGHQYETVAYFFTRKEAEKYVQYQGHNLNQPRVFTDYAGYSNDGDFPILSKLLLRMGQEINEKGSDQ